MHFTANEPPFSILTADFERPGAPSFKRAQPLVQLYVTGPPGHCLSGSFLRALTQQSSCLGRESSTAAHQDLVFSSLLNTDGATIFLELGA